MTMTHLSSAYLVNTMAADGLAINIGAADRTENA